MKESIIKVLHDIHEAKEAMEINDLLGLTTAEEYRLLLDELAKLVDEYVLFYTKKGKYILLKNCPSLKIGKLSVNKKGFGFVLLDKEDDIYIDAHNLNNAVDEDIVLCEVITKVIKKEGKIVRIIKRDLKNLVGEILFKENIAYLKIDDSKKDIIVELDKHSASNVVEGHKVLVEIVKEKKRNHYVASLIKIIGHKDDPQVDILSIAYKYGIYEDFGEEVEQELVDIPTSVSEEECKGRVDLTDKMIFTIDGKDTKDIDDAIHLELLDNGNYELGVHIADVSHYVKENTALGDKAFERGTSSYLADTVIPMIPHKLSNGICSLNEGVKRLAMSCVMQIDTKGKIVDYDIFESVICSRKKMNYRDVNDIIERDRIPAGYEQYAPTLKKMNELHLILRKEKIGRGYIDFELDEAKAIQDEHGTAIDIVKIERENGEKLIEDFMIAANETVATHIANMNLPFIYRVHEDPKPEKIEEFLTLVHLLGYKLDGKWKKLTPKTMQHILEQLRDKPEFPILSNLLLRSMRKAEYSKDNVGHFGLASASYTHFTSPIRRFPDLQVHRLLKKYLVEHDMSIGTIQALENSLVVVASQSSEREVAAQNAERDVLDMKMAEYMEQHIGEEYVGMITTITSFGFFVELPNLVEGLVHVNTLKGDYYTYIPELCAMIGKSTKKQYRLGDHVRIKVVAASKENSLIDFEVLEDKKEAVKDGNQK